MVLSDRLSATRWSVSVLKGAYTPCGRRGWQAGKKATSQCTQALHAMGTCKAAYTMPEACTCPTYVACPVLALLPLPPALPHSKHAPGR